jgi:hypothetical protein
MLIGGYDLTFPTTLSVHDALEGATNTILDFWKEGFVEAEVDKKSLVIDPYNRKLPEGVTHVFIYQNRESYQAWETEGWNEAWAYGMIYLSMYEGSLNCVLENPEDSRLKPIVEAIRNVVI